MKCETCVLENKESVITVGLMGSTLMGYSEYYDKDGKYHSHNPNIFTVEYSCSNGHHWKKSTKRPCPTCGSDWNKPEKTSVVYNQSASGIYMPEEVKT